MSEIRVNTLSDAAGTGPATLTKQSACKFWIEFNGIGTVSVVNSFNLSSLTDTGTGSYGANLTNSFTAADYSCSGVSRRAGIGFGIAGHAYSGAGLISLWTATAAGGFSDNSNNTGQAWGDLA